MMSYFTRNELSCRHCGEYYFDSDFLIVINQIREEADWPFVVTSAYRCPGHPMEATKAATGTHVLGLAVDVLCHGEKALELIVLAQKYGVQRIGVNQKGKISNRFIHLDWGHKHNFPNPAIWSY